MNKIDRLQEKLEKELKILKQTAVEIKSLPDYAEFVKGYNCGGYHD